MCPDFSDVSRFYTISASFAPLRRSVLSHLLATCCIYFGNVAFTLASNQFDNNYSKYLFIAQMLRTVMLELIIFSSAALCESSG